MLPKPSSRRLPAAALLLLLLAPALRAQSKETLGTKLTAAGTNLTFTWDPKHPWAAQMGSSGVQLFAEYATHQQGRVVEKLDTSRPAAATLHEVVLHLPGALRATPQGANVCLFLQLSDGRRIPLRKPSASVPDTERFALPAWSAAASGSAAAHSHQATLDALQSTIDTTRSRIDAQQKSLDDKGWNNQAACENVRPPAFAPNQKPADVLPAEQHHDEAEKVCVRRVLVFRSDLLEAAHSGRLKDPSIAAFLVPDPPTEAKLLDYLSKQRDGNVANLRQRSAQFADYKSAWNRWAEIARNEIARNVTPTYGRSDDDLELQDVTAEVGYEILDFSHPDAPTLKLTPHPDTRDVAGYLGGGLETYTRCVADGQKELAAKLKAWQEQVARAPMLEGMAKSQLRTQCLNSFADLAKATAQLATLKQQLAAEQALQPTAVQTTATAPTAASLNFASCTLP